ncbi:hypothetical protein OIU84_015826 [Salix udensis]|uniref:Phospholipase A1 n=1 Tax=Salix udensis TaxID=889485 RepID=A0AAD6NPP6_9ROSI|nr:hypothetical protein OIU84_015826 [Salix udensis]
MMPSVGLAKPCTVPPTMNMTLECCTLAQPIKLNKKFIQTQPLEKWEGLLDPVRHETATASRPGKLRRKWMEYQGIRNWEGLLDPLDDNLRGEILRYGHFVDAAYKSFDFDPSSPTYATCRFPKSTLFERSGKPDTGYRLTKHLRATSGIQIPRWVDKAPSWVFTQSSWIGYVAVSQNKAEIARLGRRDVVIAFRGTATCLEWLENLRATLTQLPNTDCNRNGSDECGPMVESGFFSLYTSGTKSGF